jgi:hypothetical protein
MEPNSRWSCGAGRAQITDRGIQEIEDLDSVVIPPEEIAPVPAAPTAHPTHTLIVWPTFALCVLLIIVAVAFVWAKAGGQTDVSIFGITFSSASVGAFAIFCVLAMVVLNFRRILTSVERTK